jgi:hypothetical protein
MIISDALNRSVYPPEWKRIEGSTGGVYSVLSYGLTDSSMDDNHAALVREPNGWTIVLDYDALRAAVEHHSQYGDLISNTTQFYGIFYIMDPRLNHMGKIEHAWLRIATGQGIGSLRVKKDSLGVRINADHLVRGMSKSISLDQYIGPDNYVNLPVFWNDSEQALVICFTFPPKG